MLKTALIFGEDHPWKDVYAPGRAPFFLSSKDPAAPVQQLMTPVGSDYAHCR